MTVADKTTRAKTNDILREQLEYLIDHVGDSVVFSCSECRRYLRVRSILLQIFRSCKERHLQPNEVKGKQADLVHGMPFLQSSGGAVQDSGSRCRRQKFLS